MYYYIMEDFFSVEKIKKIEAKEFKRRKGNSFSLMLEAGTNCAKKIMELTKKQPITIVAGKGNNGGDGFIIAEYLRKKKFEVEVYCLNKKLYKGDSLKAIKRLKIKPKNISTYKAKKIEEIP